MRHSLKAQLIAEFLVLFGILFTVTSTLAQSPTPKPRIGIAVPLSGPLARMGVAAQNGVQLFKEREPPLAESVDYVIDDHAYDGKRVVSALTKFAEIDKAKLAFVWGNMPSSVSAPLAKGLGLPLILGSMDLHSDKIEQVVELGVPLDALIDGLVRELMNFPASARMAISLDIGNAVEALDRVDSLLGDKVQRHIVSGDSNDFRSLLLRAKSEERRVIMLFLLPEQALALARQSAELRYDPTILGGDLFADDDFLEKVKGLLPHVSFVYGAVDPWFRQAYRDRFGNSSFLFEAANGYAFAKIAARLAALEPKLQALPLRKQLTRISLEDLAIAQPRLMSGPDQGFRISCGYELSSAVK